MKVNTVNLLKFKRLCHHLGETTRGVVGLLELMWVGAAQNCPQGDIGRFSNEEIAIMCDWDGNPDDLVNALVETNWLDECGNHRLLIHDWKDHAPSYVKSVLSRQGKSFANREPNRLANGLTNRDANSLANRDPNLEATINHTNSIHTNSDQVSMSVSTDSGGGSDPPDSLGEQSARLQAAWNDATGVVPFRKLTEKRQKALRARLPERIHVDGQDLPWIEAALLLIPRSFPLPFTTQPGSTWTPDIEWFLKPDSLVKIAEGKYHGRGSPAPQFRSGARYYEDTEREVKHGDDRPGDGGEDIAPEAIAALETFDEF